MYPYDDAMHIHNPNVLRDAVAWLETVAMKVREQF
jgi:hypothetical protein